MSVLELARRLTGLEIEENPPLFQALKKLPSLEELKIISEVKVKVSDGIDKESFGFDEKTALPDSEVNRENPLFQESSLDEASVNLKKNAAEILERFEKLYQTQSLIPREKKPKQLKLLKLTKLENRHFI